jgi:HEAT repeat protein
LGYDPSWLIQQVLYGMESGAGEQLLLAALIAQESNWTSIDTQVITHLVHSLIYYLNSRREPRIWRRIQLAEALGKVRHPDAIPHLVGVTNQRIRLTSLGRERDYEIDTVRLAAVMALRQIAQSPYSEVRHIDPELAKILTWWDEGDIVNLSHYLVDADKLPEEQKGSQAIAAFALGDLQTVASVDILINLFLYPNSPDATYRHLTTALSLIDPGIVENSIILPFIEKEGQNRLSAQVWEKREQYLSHIISLAGMIYTSDTRILAFLYGCLLNDPKINNRVLAIQSLGWLQEVQLKTLIEKIAIGQLQDLQLPSTTTYAEKQALQQQALQALYYLGDAETLKLFHRRPASWLPEYERILYWASEEILWRQEMQHHL